MKAGDGANGDASLVRPTHCEYGEISALGEMICNACPAGHTCGSDQFDKNATPCTADKTNSLDNEFMCYPHLSTWPQMPVYPTDPDNVATFTTDTIGTPATTILEITSGSFSYTGTLTSYDCPPGHQCIFPQF